MIRLVTIITLLLLQVAFPASGNPELKSQRQIMHFPAGIHRLPEIVSSTDYLSIKGDGSGITILEVPGGITLTGKDPRLSGFTLVGMDNKRTGLTLRNNYRALVQDVEIRGFKLGLLSICDFGQRQWLHTYRDLYIYEGEDGSLASSNPDIHGVELRYLGEKTDKGQWKSDGGFSNTHTFYGGRIAVPGVPLLIDGPTATAMFGTYVDISQKPMRMTERSAGLQLFGTHLDRNRSARKQDIPALVLENPKFNRVKIFGQHAGILDHNLIRDSKGHPVDRKFFYLSPDTY